jgi:hypothetical protein
LDWSTLQKKGNLPFGNRLCERDYWCNLYDSINVSTDYQNASDVKQADTMFVDGDSQFYCVIFHWCAAWAVPANVMPDRLDNLPLYGDAMS